MFREERKRAQRELEQAYYLQPGGSQIREISYWEGYLAALNRIEDIWNKIIETSSKLNE